MHVLLVDDDDNKRRQLGRAIREALAGCVVVEARSFQTALRALGERRFEVAVLDMTLPAFDVTRDDDGGRTLPFGGRDLIEQMAARGITTPTILVTQFDRFGAGVGQTLAEVSGELSKRHKGMFIGAVFFDIAAAGWRQELTLLLRRSVGGRRL